MHGGIMQDVGQFDDASDDDEANLQAALAAHRQRLGAAAVALGGGGATSSVAAARAPSHLSHPLLLLRQPPHSASAFSREQHNFEQQLQEQLEHEARIRLLYGQSLGEASALGSLNASLLALANQHRSSSNALGYGLLGGVGASLLSNAMALRAEPPTPLLAEFQRQQLQEEQRQKKYLPSEQEIDDKEEQELRQELFRQQRLAAAQFTQNRVLESSSSRTTSDHEQQVSQKAPPPPKHHHHHHQQQQQQQAQHRTATIHPRNHKSKQNESNHHHHARVESTHHHNHHHHNNKNNNNNNNNNNKSIKESIPPTMIDHLSNKKHKKTPIATTTTTAAAAAATKSKTAVSSTHGNVVQNIALSWTVKDLLYKSSVSYASYCVGMELQHGVWPSPMVPTQLQNVEASHGNKGLVVATTNGSGSTIPTTKSQQQQQQQQQSIYHKTHMQRVAASLNDFCLRVVLPSLQVRRNSSSNQRIEEEMGQQGPSTHHPTPSTTIPTTTTAETTTIPDVPVGRYTEAKNVPRAFFATLLALREIMTQNALTIFGREAFEDALQEESENQKNNDDDDDAVGRDHGDDDSGEKDYKNTLDYSLKRQNMTEDWLHLARTLATAVVVGGMERCFAEMATRQELVATFLKHAQSYDYGGNEFSNCIPPEPHEEGGYVQSVLENGKRLNEEEEVARSVSFGLARKRHPLVQRKRLKSEKSADADAAKLWIRVPETTACHIAVIEKPLTLPTTLP